MECEVSPIVSLYVDGELDEPGRRRAEDHINSCDECRETLAAFLSLRERAERFEATRDPFVQRRTLAAVLAAGRTPPWRRRISVPVAALPVLVLVSSAGAFLAGRSVAPAVRETSSQTEPAAHSRREEAGGFLARFDRGGRALVAVVPNEHRAGAGGEEP